MASQQLKPFLKKLPFTNSGTQKAYIKPPRLSSSVIDQIQRALLLINPLSQEPHFSIAFGSCNSGAGVTMISLNFAEALARKGRKTVFVEANFRSPCIAGIFDLPDKPGLVQCLNGDSNLAESVHQAGSLNFALIPAGANTGKAPPDLGALPALLDQLKSIYDTIVIDTAAVLPYFETTTLASSADGFILLLETDRDKWEVAKSATRVLDEADVNILGAILNRRKHYIPQFIYDLL